MVRALKWAAVLASLGAVATVFAPAVWPVSHPQALTNVIVGEFAAIAIGYTAYRLTYGKGVLRSAALGAAVCGTVLAVSPLQFGLVDGFTSVNMVGGGLVAVVGLLAVAATFRGEEGREVTEVARGRESGDDQAKAA